MKKIVQIFVLIFAIYMPSTFLQAQSNPCQTNIANPEQDQATLLAQKGVQASLSGAVIGLNKQAGTLPVAGAGAGLIAGGNPIPPHPAQNTAMTTTSKQPCKTGAKTSPKGSNQSFVQLGQ